jgi:cell division protein FtsB
VVAVFSLLALLATAGVKSYSDLARARAHEADLTGRIAAAEARIRVLREDVRRMGEDPLTLERLARENLGMVMPGDVVIVLPEEGSLTDEAADASARRDR